MDDSISSGGFQMVFVIFAIALVVFLIASIWKVFEKAGQPGWAAIIPFYNLYIMTKIAGKPGYWVLLMLIPYIGLIWSIWTYNMISKSFGKSEAFTVGLVLLSFIFWPILGFGDAKYLGPYGSEGASNMGSDILDA